MAKATTVALLLLLSVSFVFSEGEQNATSAEISNAALQDAPAAEEASQQNGTTVPSQEHPKNGSNPQKPPVTPQVVINVTKTSEKPTEHTMTSSASPATQQNVTKPPETTTGKSEKSDTKQHGTTPASSGTSVSPTPKSAKSTSGSSPILPYSVLIALLGVVLCVNK